MAKDDPAFLFYAKDWLSGTTDMSIQEKGVYIDLLAHQHQSGGLPTDINRLARMVHLSKDEFLVIWEYLKVKFIEKDGVLQNRKLVKVISARSEHAESRTIIGTFGSLMRELQASEGAKYYIRKKFFYKDFVETYNENKVLLYDLLSKWVSKCLATYVIENETGTGNEINNIKSNKFQEQMIVKDMLAVWMKYNPNYQYDVDVDFPALLSLAYKIAKSKKWEQREVIKEKLAECIESWDNIAKFVRKDDFYKKFELKNLERNWAGLYQTMLAEKEGSTKVKPELRKEQPTAPTLRRL